MNKKLKNQLEVIESKVQGFIGYKTSKKSKTKKSKKK